MTPSAKQSLVDMAPKYILEQVGGLIDCLTRSSLFVEKSAMTYQYFQSFVVAV
jgi:hypothetical protein